MGPVELILMLLIVDDSVLSETVSDLSSESIPRNSPSNSSGQSIPTPSLDMSELTDKQAQGRCPIEAPIELLVQESTKTLDSKV